MLRLSLVQLRRRPLHYLWLGLGVFLAVAVTIGTAAISATLANSAHHMVERGYAATDVVAQLAPTDAATAEEVGEAVASTPGVADTTFDQVGTVSVAVGGALHEAAPVTTLSPGPQQWRGVKAGRLPETPDEVVTTAEDVPLGSQHLLRPRERGNPVTVTVVGHVSTSPAEDFKGSAVWLAPPEALTAWFPERVTGEYRVAATAGTDPWELVAELESVLLPIEGANIRVSTAGERVTELVDSYLDDHMVWFLTLGLFLLAIAVATALLLFSCWLLILRRRETDLLALRALGTTSGQQRIGLLVEALVVAIPAWALGVPVGFLLARLLAGELGAQIPLSTVTLDPVAHLIIGIAAAAICVATALSAHRRVGRRLAAPGRGPQTGVTAQVIALISGVAALAIGVSGTRVQSSGEPTSAATTALLTTVALVAGTALLAAAVIPACWHAATYALPESVPQWARIGVAGAARHRGSSVILAAVLVSGVTLTSLVLHAEKPLRDALTPQTSSGVSGPPPDATITGAADSLSPSLLEKVRDLPGVSDVSAPPSVTVSGSQGPTDTGFAVSAADAAADTPGHGPGEGYAGPAELILGTMSPLRSVLVNGSVTSLRVLGQPYEMTVIFGDGPRTLFDVEVARDAQAVVAGQRGIPPEIAPELPAPVAMVRLTDRARHDEPDTTLDQLRGLLAGHNQQVSLDVRAVAPAGTGPSGWLVAVVPGLLVLLTSLGIAANLIAYTARDRRRGDPLLRSPGLTRAERLAAVGTEAAAIALPAAVLGVAGGTVVAGHVMDLLVPAATVDIGDVSVLTRAGIVVASAAVVVICAAVQLLRVEDEGAAASLPVAQPAPA